MMARSHYRFSNLPKDEEEQEFGGDGEEVGDGKGGEGKEEERMEEELGDGRRDGRGVKKRVAWRTLRVPKQRH